VTVAEIEGETTVCKAAGAARGKNLVPTSAAQMASMLLSLLADRDRWFLRAWQQGGRLVHAMRKHFDQVPQTIKLLRLTDADGFLIGYRGLRKHSPVAFTEQSRILAVALGRKRRLAPARFRNYLFRRKRWHAAKAMWGKTPDALPSLFSADPTLQEEGRFRPPPLYVHFDSFCHTDGSVVRRTSPALRL
jgi:hypothetical protein